MKEDEIEELGDIDILILPVGGNTVLSASTASKVVNQVEPKLVIPSHYLMKELIPYTYHSQKKPNSKQLPSWRQTKTF
jgi:L-ascorbate metabolism protein UlaG (beta-lactamase superfamily)